MGTRKTFRRVTDADVKLVLLEIMIVVVATRAVLSLLGSTTPSWPNPLWVIFALVAIAATAALIITEVRKRFGLDRADEQPVAAPHIPLDRIAPFTEDALVVRYGAGGRPNIHLN
jgi:RsiW-degrading membrane proteinase PrsW (M82 family)